MKTYNLVDKNSDVVITVSGENEDDALANVKDRIAFLDQFRIECVDEDEDNDKLDL